MARKEIPQKACTRQMRCGEFTYTLSPLPHGPRIKFVQALNGTDAAKSNPIEDEQLICDTVFASIKVKHPAVTREEFESVASSEDLFAAFFDILASEIERTKNIAREVARRHSGIAALLQQRPPSH